MVQLVTTAECLAAPALSGGPGFREFSLKVNYFDEFDEAWIEKYRAARNEEAAKKSWFERLVAALLGGWRSDSRTAVPERKTLTLLGIEAPKKREELINGRAA